MRMAVAGGTGICGSFVVSAARSAGHEVVVLSRANGIDLLADAGLAEALSGVSVIVDATNTATRSLEKAAAFFESVTDRLHRIGEAAGVSRLVTLSIVGIDRASAFGYYAAKLRQEAAASRGPLASTIVRATQFHEFPGQIIAQTKVGSVAFVPMMRSQPLAARVLGELLVDVATSARGAAMIEVAGPAPEDVVLMARRLVRHRHRRMRIMPIRMPGDAGRAFRGGALLAGDGVHIIGPAFDEWLESEDSALPAF
jgi:uncharacterized protein YbjT (DUF2867 family)